MSFSVPVALYDSLDSNIKRLAGIEGISNSEWIWKQLRYAVKIKSEGNPQVQLPHITVERGKLSKTVRAKFLLQEMDGSLTKLEAMKNPKAEMQAYNFHMANIRKKLPEAEALMKFVFKDRFMAVLKRIDKLL
jgi:hypothetical protein